LNTNKQKLSKAELWIVSIAELLLLPTIPPNALTAGDEDADDAEEAIDPLLCKLVSFIASRVFNL